jgi:type II secretory pathway pseudopilin PulG
MHRITRLFIASLPILPIVLLSTLAQAFSEAHLYRANLTSAKLADVKLMDDKLTNARGPRSIALKPTDNPPPDRLALRLKQREALQLVGTLNRAQQAYYLEKDRFTTSIEATGMGIKPDTEDYRYRLFVAPDRYPAAMQVALPKTSDLVTFLGLVYATKLDGQSATIAKLCVSEKPGTPMPIWSAIDYKNPKKGDPIACPFGFTPVK